jgi:hypothetical protein
MGDPTQASDQHAAQARVAAALEREIRSPRKPIAVKLNDRRWAAVFVFAPGVDGYPVVREMRIVWRGDGAPADLNTGVIKALDLGDARRRALARLVRESAMWDEEYELEPPSLVRAEIERGDTTTADGTDVTDWYIDEVLAGRRPPSRAALRDLAELARLFVDGGGDYKALATSLAARDRRYKPATLRTKTMKARQAGLLTHTRPPATTQRCAQLLAPGPPQQPH